MDWDCSVSRRVILLRHGKTAGNLRHAYVGFQTDEPLCEKGLRELHEYQPLPEYKRVFISPLMRARQTAAYCFPQAELIEVPGFKEMNFGIFEGKNYEDLQEVDSYRAWLDSYCKSRCPGGDSRDSFVSRVVENFESLLCREKEEPLVIVAHGGTIMALLSSLAVPQEQRDYFDWQVGCAKGFSFLVEGNEESGLQAHHIVPFALKKKNIFY